MESERLVALRSFTNEHITVRYFDIFPVLTFLFESKKISLSFYLRMRQKFMSGEKSLRILLDLTEVCRLNDLVYALYMGNCSEIAKRLQQQRRRSSQHNIPRARPTMSTRNISVSTTVHHFYIKMKRDLDTSTFVNPMDFLKHLVERFSHQIESLPLGSQKREHIVNKLLVVQSLKLQIYTKPSDRFAILNDMENTSTLSTKQSEWDALIMGKLLYTYALEGNITAAEEYYQGINFVLATSNAGFITYNIYYNAAMGKLGELERTFSEKIKTRMLFYASTALHSLADEDDTVREHWSRILILAMCRCLLGVGTNFSSLAYEVTPQDRMQAKLRLEQFNQISDDIGIRREMMYCFLMAKAMSEENIHDALLYAHRALALSEEGAYREIEKQNISNLVSLLQSKQ